MKLLQKFQAGWQIFFNCKGAFFSFDIEHKKLQRWVSWVPSLLTALLLCGDMYANV